MNPNEATFKNMIGMILTDCTVLVKRLTIYNGNILTCKNFVDKKKVNKPPIFIKLHCRQKRDPEPKISKHNNWARFRPGF